MKFVVLCTLFVAVVKILLEERTTLEEVSLPSPEKELGFPCWLDEGLQRLKWGLPHIAYKMNEAVEVTPSPRLPTHHHHPWLVYNQVCAHASIYKVFLKREKKPKFQGRSLFIVQSADPLVLHIFIFVELGVEPRSFHVWDRHLNSKL